MRIDQCDGPSKNVTNDSTRQDTRLCEEAWDPPISTSTGGITLEPSPSPADGDGGKHNGDAAAEFGKNNGDAAAEFGKNNGDAAVQFGKNNGDAAHLEFTPEDFAKLYGAAALPPAAKTLTGDRSAVAISPGKWRTRS